MAKISSSFISQLQVDRSAFYESCSMTLPDLFVRARFIVKSGILKDEILEISIESDVYGPLIPLNFYQQSTEQSWITFPIQYGQLPLDSFFKIVSGTTILYLRLFDTVTRQLKCGMHLSSLSPQNVTEDDPWKILVKAFEEGQIPREPWLDQKTFGILKTADREDKNEKGLKLFVDLPLFDLPVIYEEKQVLIKNDYSKPPGSLLDNLGFNLIRDDDFIHDNVVEAMHRKLVRANAGPRYGNHYDRDLKPNSKIRDELHNILNYPPTQTLKTEEKDLIWKFRYFLSREKRGLTKFLKSVFWEDKAEVKQALDLLTIWCDIDVEDGLELLSPVFFHARVRSHAVKVLEKAEDQELVIYLLQLVQALKYEHIHYVETDSTVIMEDNPSFSPLVRLLVERSLENEEFGCLLFWYLRVESLEKAYGKWFETIQTYYLKELEEKAVNGKQRCISLEKQLALIANLSNVLKIVKGQKFSRAKKIENLRILMGNSEKYDFQNLEGISLPLDPAIKIRGIRIDTVNLFKSSLMPLKVDFIACLNELDYPVIFKYGDDLRQDQLVIQMISLMDMLLRKENLDLKLTPYKVLATSLDEGMIQYVPSKPLALILSEHNGSLQAYLKGLNATDSQVNMEETFGIHPTVMDTYVKSCAGYCVITYLLGIGDRHLDNLLLTPAGNLFHIDFGFMLGRDPKPFPPPMKLCKEMVEAMGGASSAHYVKFKSLCFVAFNILRKSHNLIINLFALMMDSNIPDISLEPEMSVLKLQEKFRLDLSEDEAIQFFSTMINDSVSALFPQVMETIHKWAQYWRK